MFTQFFFACPDKPPFYQLHFVLHALFLQNAAVITSHMNISHKKLEKQIAKKWKY